MYTAHEFSWSTEMICGLHCTIVGCLGRRREFLVFSMTLWRNTLCWWSIWIGAMKMLNKHVNCICNLWQYLPFTIIFSEYFIHSLFVFFFRVSFSIYFWCHSFNVVVNVFTSFRLFLFQYMDIFRCMLFSLLIGNSSQFRWVQYLYNLLKTIGNSECAFFSTLLFAFIFNWSTGWMRFHLVWSHFLMIFPVLVVVVSNKLWQEKRDLNRTTNKLKRQILKEMTRYGRNK